MKNNMNQTKGESDALCGVCSDDVQQDMKDVTFGGYRRWFYHASSKISSFMFYKTIIPSPKTHLSSDTAMNLNV